MNFVKQPDGSYIEVGSMASVSGKVVDDTKEFGVPVSGVPPPVCEDYYTESECVAAGCSWYDGACHPKEVEIPWIIILAAVGGAIALIGVALALRR